MDPSKKIPLGMSVQDALSEGEVDLSDLDTSVSYWKDPEYKRMREELTEKNQRELDELYAQGKMNDDDDDGIEF